MDTFFASSSDRASPLDAVLEPGASIFFLPAQGTVVVLSKRGEGS
jgi:hypothetical protein